MLSSKLLAPLVATLLLIQSAHSFSPASKPLILSRVQSCRSAPSTFAVVQHNSQHVVLHSSPDDNEEVSEESTPDAPKVESTAVSVEKSDPYPVDLPSPVLLSSSMVLAIAGVGSVFELTGGSPVLGFGPTAAIAAVGLPSCLFLFYAAIKKGEYETEQDDLEYNKPRGRL
eukprot:scaffold3204_cov185-Alexandrium_tamarense.AAC.2